MRPQFQPLRHFMFDDCRRLFSAEFSFLSFLALATAHYHGHRPRNMSGDTVNGEKKTLNPQVHAADILFAGAAAP